MILGRLALTALLATFSVQAQDWPGWRGPAGNGIAPTRETPLKWDRETNIKWRTPLTRAGNGSPIVSGDRVFLAAAEDNEGKGRSLYCYDRSNGKQLWVSTVDFPRSMPTHRTNPHCSTTPAADGKRVIVWHASAGLYCYDFAGKKLWQRDLGVFEHQWGHGTSPVLYKDHVILHSGPGEQSFIAAFDIKTGKTIWKQDEPKHLSEVQIKKKRLAGSWCTPLIHPQGARDLVLCAHSTRLVAYDASDGKIIWWCQGVTGKRGDLVYSSPIVVDDLCMVQGGYEGPTLGVQIDGKGDVTESHQRWRHPGMMSNCSSGVAVEGYIFIVDMNSIVRCIDPTDGQALWKKRVGRGESWGSIVAVDDHLYMLNQAGTTIVFEANAKGPVVLAENKLGEAANSTPAFAGEEIFIRTHKALYCIAKQK